jgi:hypothetical protein
MYVASRVDASLCSVRVEYQYACVGQEVITVYQSRHNPSPKDGKKLNKRNVTTALTSLGFNGSS